MSSFLFLHFCDDVFELLGLYFSAFILSRVSSGGFLPLPSKPPHGPRTGPTGAVWRFAGVSFPTHLLTGQKPPHRGESCFSPRTNSPLPLKGEGLDIARLGFAGFALLVHNRATVAQQGWGFGGVRFPTLSPKPHTGPHRAEFGFSVFGVSLVCSQAYSRIRFSRPVLGSPILYFRHRNFRGGPSPVWRCERPGLLPAFFTLLFVFIPPDSGQTASRYLPPVPW